MNETDVRYAAVISEGVRGVADVQMISSAIDDRALIVPRQVALLCEHCTAPRTLAEHQRHLTLSLGLVASDCSRALAELVRAGLLVPWPVGDAPAALAAQKVAALAIVTADRSALLKRGLASHLQCLKRHGRKEPVVVFDASRESSSAEDNICIVQQASSKFGTPVIYVGSGERGRLRRSLASRGVSPAVLEWLLPEPPPLYAAGAARNLMLLSLAGTQFVSVDDDTVCHVRRPPWFRPGMTFGGHANVRQTEWFDDRASSVGGGIVHDVDPFCLHEDLLGSTLRNLYLRFARKCDALGACSHVRLAMSGASEGRMRATWTGIAGDSAQYCPFWNLFATAATRDRMASSEVGFRKSLSSREVLRSVANLTVTDESAFMTYCAGFDATDILPPFNPTGFNEDGLFGAMLRLADPSAFIGEVPEAIVHDSSRASFYSDDAPASARQIRLIDVILWLVRPTAAVCVKRSPVERLRWIGERLCEVGELVPDEFRRVVKRVVVEAKWSLVCRCESLLSNGWPYPEYWRAAIEDYRDAVIDSFGTPGFYVPIEYQSGSVETGLSRVQAHLVMFGKAISEWPDVWSAARDVRSPLLLQDIDFEQSSRINALMT